MKKGMIDDEGYQAIGQRHHCDKVADEATEVSARWTRDGAVLGKRGFGAKSLARFDALRAQHDQLRKDRPQAVAAKANTVEQRNAEVEKGWAWVAEAVSVIGRVAREDGAIATRLEAARPSHDAELATRIGTLAGLLGDVKDRVDEEADVAGKVAAASALQASLGAAPGKVALAKVDPVLDTAEIDVLDGKLYIAMRDLNESAREAIRNGALHAAPGEYRFHHLSVKDRGAPAGEAKPPVSGAPATNATG